MQPTTFPESNVVYAKDQPEYRQLPAFRESQNPFTVVSCWKLSFLERIRVFFTGKVWFSQLTFGHSLQPQLPTVEKPLRAGPGAKITLEYPPE